MNKLERFDKFLNISKELDCCDPKDAHTIVKEYHQNLDELRSKLNKSESAKFEKLWELKDELDEYGNVPSVLIEYGRLVKEIQKELKE